MSPLRPSLTAPFALMVALVALGGCSDKSDDSDTGDSGLTGGGGSGSGSGGEGTGGDTSGGSGGDDGGTGGDDLSPAQQFLLDYSTRGCDLYKECSPPEVLESYPYEQCIAQIEAAVANYPEGVCDFNESAAAECMSWINAVDCDGYSEDAPEACNIAITCPD